MSAPYPSFLDYLRERYGRNWVVARRTSRIIARYGEDVHCFSPAAYQRVEDEWANNHPTIKLALTLPPSEERDLIVNATRRVLR